MIRFISIIILSLFCQNILASSDPNPIIPRKVLFGNPEKINVQLSPDSKYISYLAPKDGILNLWIAKKDDIQSARAITQDKKSLVRAYEWAYDGKHILYTQDNNGDEKFRLFTYNIETGKSRAISKKGTRVDKWIKNELKPNEIVLTDNTRDPCYYDLYKINLIDYKQEMVFENNKFINFILDNNLVPRFGEAFKENGTKEYYKINGSDYEPFISYDVGGELNKILGFDKSNTVIYMQDSVTTDMLAIKSLDLNTGKIEVLYKDKKADVGPATLSLQVWKNIQILKVDYDKATYKAVDKSFFGDIKYLQDQSSGHFEISGRSTDDKFWLVYYHSDTMPEHYYLYDRENKEVKFLFSSRPELEKYTLSPMKPVIIKARDGLEMVSYLTLPQKVETDKPLPMILLVHGGPIIAKDCFGLHRGHQWLANRGYAVLSVNYRGSMGFGKNFLKSGYGQWGRKMHNDLIDAVNWAIKEKLADPKKICIMGGSYGGYAVLAGMTFTADVFACGVEWVGISNLITQQRAISPYDKPKYGWYKQIVGDLDTEEGLKDLWERSPLRLADKIKKPLLIAHGVNDPRVKQAESEQIVEVMNKHNIPVIYALYQNEGHGFARPESRLSFNAMIEQFLAKILGGRAEVIGDDFEGANFLLNGKKNVTPEEASNIIKKNISNK